MIIIDEDKLKKLLKTKRTQKVSDEIIAEEESFRQYLDMIAGIYTLEVRETLGVLLGPSQINIKLISSDPNRNTKDYSVSFKPNMRNIALLDNLEEIIELQPEFRPPLLIRTQREVNWAETSGTVPYDELRYWPWGYDLERNVQIWKKR